MQWCVVDLGAHKRPLCLLFEQPLQHVSAVDFVRLLAVAPLAKEVKWGETHVIFCVDRFAQNIEL